LLAVAETWTLIFYRAPAQPSSARVTAWRRLHRLGAVYIGPSACALPTRLVAEDGLSAVAGSLRSAGGSFDAYVVERFEPDAERRLIALYNAARDAEYDELIERAQAVVAELEREGARDKFTFAEVEENEADLVRLQRWARRITWRDVFGASRREAGEAAVRVAHERLDAFARVATDRDSGPVDLGVVVEADGELDAENAQPHPGVEPS
jgi:hypothetical protein